MRKTAVVGTNILISMAKQMRDRGEITREQFNEIKKRNATIVPAEWKETRMVCEMDKKDICK